MEENGKCGWPNLSLNKHGRNIEMLPHSSPRICCLPLPNSLAFRCAAHFRMPRRSPDLAES
ncbi:hypothetical protein ACVIU4_000913 [Bradyrhizobium barranii subsp. barranii]|nr:hypothetical protein [Bradyrhizobium japonicum]MCP1963812.1 hypothetical protein [Bradyrhizobium japonicum]